MRFVQIKQQKHHQNVKCRIKTNRFTKKNIQNAKVTENSARMMIVIVTICTKEKKTHTHPFKQFWTECIIYTFFRLWRYFHFFFLGHIRCWIWDGWIETFVPCGTRLWAANSTLLVNALRKTVNLLVPWTFLWGDKIPIRVGFHNAHTRNPAPIILYSIWYNMQCILYIVLLSNYLQYFAPSFGLNWCCWIFSHFTKTNSFIWKSSFIFLLKITYVSIFILWIETKLRNIHDLVCSRFCSNSVFFFWTKFTVYFLSFNLALCRFTLSFTQMSLQNTIPNAKMIFIFTCNSNIS